MNDVTKATVINSFQKLKISRKNKIHAVVDNDYRFKGLQEYRFLLQQYNLEFACEELTTEDFANTLSNVITTDLPMNKIEILQSPNLKEENKISKGDGIGIIDEPVAEPNSIEV